MPIANLVLNIKDDNVRFSSLEKTSQVMFCWTLVKQAFCNFVS